MYARQSNASGCLKALGSVGLLDHPRIHLVPGVQRPDPLDERPRVCVIGPNQPQVGKFVPQDLQK